MSDGQPDPPLAHPDFVDLVACLAEEGCEFLIVGAHALAAHGCPRATGDLDVWIRPTAANASRVMAALARFGAPVQAHGLTEQDLATPGMVYQMGLPPRRIDVLTELSGLTWGEGARDPLPGHLGPVPVRYLGLAALVANKRATGRAKDLVDVAMLEEVQARRAGAG